MGRVLKANFYYGAILTTILQKNPDAIPTLILADGESKQIYKMITNSSYFKITISLSRKFSVLTHNKQINIGIFSFK